jgi:Tat protein translocase TatC
VGIAASIPVIVYHALGFFAPLVRIQTRRLLVRYSLISGVLAAAGFCFGYFFGLPAALHFLTNQFTTSQIRALFTLQEYMNFLMIYLLGSALLFQLPIILLFINRIRPLKPRKLLGAERYVIVAAFVIAMIMTPTTDIFNQSIIAVPIILIYNLSVLMVWRASRDTGRPERIAALLEQDQAVQVGRLTGARTPLPSEPLMNAPSRTAPPAAVLSAEPPVAAASAAPSAEGAPVRRVVVEIDEAPQDVMPAPVRRLAVNYFSSPGDVVNVRLVQA